LTAAHHSAGKPETVNGEISTKINAFVEVTSLNMEELMLMGADTEEPGEVLDQFSNPPHLRLRKKSQKKAVTIVPGLESTPTKAIEASPRRSPRNISEADGVLINIIRIVINDTKGVDSRLDVPKILIFSHCDTTLGNDVEALKTVLQDKSDNRLRLQFDLCKLIYAHLLGSCCSRLAALP
jgi:hypothetical protein